MDESTIITVIDGATGLTPDMLRGPNSPKCNQCKIDTENYFHYMSGGLCGTCLADYGLPLTEIGSD